jgi:hypothetical protein
VGEPFALAANPRGLGGGGAGPQAGSFLAMVPGSGSCAGDGARSFRALEEQEAAEPRVSDGGRAPRCATGRGGLCAVDREAFGTGRSGAKQSPTPLAASYREKLVVLDSAIADLKDNVAGNQYNVYLQNQLALLYREKQKTLQEWLENEKGN